MTSNSETSEVEGPSFAQRIDQEILEFRIDFVKNVCVSRGWNADRDICASELAAAHGKLNLALSRIEETQPKKNVVMRFFSRMRSTLGFD